MDLRCYVNGKEYKDKIVQGIVVSEEYNETLDSATVILSQIPKMNDLRPYDDFFIYEGDFKGYLKGNDVFCYKSAKVSDDNLGIEIILQQLIYGDYTTDVTFTLSSLQGDLPSNFFIDIESESVQTKTTYSAVFEPREYPESDTITFTRITDTDYFPEEFKLVRHGDYFYDTLFKANTFIKKITNLRTTSKFLSFTFINYEADGRFFEDVYYYKDLSSFNAIEIPKNIIEQDSGLKKQIKILLQETFFEDENGIKILKNSTLKEYNADLIVNNQGTFTNLILKFKFENKEKTVLFNQYDDDNFYCYWSEEKNIDENNFSVIFIKKIISAKIIPVYYEQVKYDGFYKHFLVDQYTEEMLNIDEDSNKILYKYKIELFSETKKLETIQLPNFSVTQPQHGEEKKSVWYYILEVVDMYSPVYKVAADKEEKEWTYRKKYSVDESLKEIFENMYCPDFTLNNPNLRDVLSQLMLVADRIPYVEDDVIKTIDITERKNKFTIDENNNKFTNIVASRTSSNHCDNLKRTYSNALSQEKTAHSIELIGFRNSSSGMLTLENLKLETRFPIYKINKMYMCYYKKIKIIYSETWTSETIYNNGDKVTYLGEMYQSTIDNNLSTPGATSEWKKITKNKIFLCKQDITDLILLDSERNLISQDWTEIIDTTTQIDTIKEMAKYKFFTLGYNIGSNEINGFGTKYEYFTNPFWDSTATYIQNIFLNMERMYPFGIYNQDYFSDFLEDGEIIENIDYSTNDKITYLNAILIHPFTNASLGLKSLFFEIDYNAFYNGTIYHSKDTDRDDIVINDNSSSSLTLLEQDGINQKEKANRFGNKTIQISARYDDINEMQELGDVFEYGDDDDIIIYHKQYSIFDNLITCSYSGSKDYVLKNYFINVYAKHRPYNLMSYSESVRRSENRKMYIYLSKNNVYLENDNKKYNISDFENGSFIEKIISFFKSEKNYYSTGDIIKKDKINNGYIVFKDKDGNIDNYSSDINTFVSGDSLCFNLSMYDNVSAGLYLDKEQLEPETDFDSSLGLDKDELIYIRGTKQKWYLTVDNPKEGHVRELGFFVGHKEENKYFNTLYDEREIVEEIIKNDLFALPLNNNQQITNKIGDYYILNKDNKEVIDMTFQIELVKDFYNKKLFYSSLLLKLSDLNGVQNKFDKNLTENDFPNYFGKSEIFAFSNFVLPSFNILSPFGSYYAPVIIISVDISKDLTLNTDLEMFEFNCKNTDNISGSGSVDKIISYNLVLKKVVEKGDGYVRISANQKVKIIKAYNGERVTFNNDVTLKLSSIENFGFNQKPNNKIWYSNCEVSYVDKLLGGYYSVNFVDDEKIECENETLKRSYTIEHFQCFSDYKVDATVQNFTKYNTVYKTFGEQNNEANIVYHKNLYLATSDKLLDKMSVYKQFIYTGNEEKISDDIIIENNRTPENILSIEKADNGIEQLIISIPQEYIDNKVKSIQVWYLDNDDQRYVQNDMFYFVFGINLEYDEKTGEFIGFDEYDENNKIYLIKYNVSVLSARDMRVFDEKHIEIGKVKNVANSNEIETEQKYEEYEEQQ